MGLLIESLIERGEAEAAEEALDTIRWRGADQCQPGGGRLVLEARSRLRLVQGRAREALDGLVEFGRYDDLAGGAHPLASRWRSGCVDRDGRARRPDRRHGVAADDLDRASDGVREHRDRHRPACSALVDREREPDRTALQESSTSNRLPSRLEHARVLIDLGAALRRENRRSEARRSLENGLSIARRCGADALIETRTNGAPRSWRPVNRADGVRAIDELTASERRVAELAAEGQSNPEIAQALFVTRKTVETHLGHVYQKLAISGRGKLARAMAARESPIP